MDCNNLVYEKCSKYYYWCCTLKKKKKNDCLSV